VIIDPYRFGPALGVRLDTGLNSDVGGWESYGIIQRIPASSLGGAWTTCTITLEAASAEAAAFASIYIGHAAGAGDPYDAASLTQVLFSAAGNPTVSIGAQLTSDTIAFAYDGVTDLLVKFGMAAGASTDGLRALTSGSVVTHYNKSLAAGETSTANVTGYSTFNTQVYGLRKITAVS
jgi:hypothetical protein